MSKIFIIGLPRTATTSVCLGLLELGIKTAHTAYTKNCFEQAEAIADTPVFADFDALDKRFPGSKYIYLSRDTSLWLPSIRQLLARMFKNLVRADGGFNPHIKKAFLQTFPNLTEECIASDGYLLDCYYAHHKRVMAYFKGREQDILTIDVKEPDSFLKLAQFLSLEDKVQDLTQQFQKINIKGKVTAWNEVKHSLKVDSTNNGRIDKILY